MNFVPLQPLRFDDVRRDHERLSHEVMNMLTRNMILPSRMMGTAEGRYTASKVTWDSFVTYQAKVADDMLDAAALWVQKYCDEFWAAEERKKHKAEIGDAMRRSAKAMRAGRVGELDGLAPYVRELVFDHPEAEWQARLHILADYLRDTATHPEAYQAGELLGELLAEGFTLAEGTP